MDGAVSASSTADGTAGPGTSESDSESDRSDVESPNSGVDSPAGLPQPMPNSDATRDAAGVGQMFESVQVPGLTDFAEGSNGAAFADFDRDGWLDVLVVSTPPFVLETEGDDVRDRVRLLMNRGDLHFDERSLTLEGSPATPEDFGQGWRGSQIPTVVDFNNDGLLDFFVSRQAPSRGGVVRSGFTPIGNSLFIAEDTFSSFVDMSEELGIRNELAYNRQPSVGDINLDGFLDIAIGADNITNGFEGLPRSALYLFRPNGNRFAEGRFEDIAASELVSDFGGFASDPNLDTAGPRVALRDLDNDGDLDLIQSTHVLIGGTVDPRRLPLSPVSYRQGIFTWINRTRDVGRFFLEKSRNNGLADEARLRYDEDRGLYVPDGAGRAPGLAYLATADVTNSGFQDVLAVDATDATFTPKTEDVGGRFWRNLGGFDFAEATDMAGLSSLNDSYADWYAFFDNEISSELRFPNPLTPYLVAQPGLSPTAAIELRPYHADVVFADFDNNAWIDVVVLDRRESELLETRAILYLNRGDGVLAAVPTTLSGLDSSGISGEAVDLDNDGWVDLYIARDPDNSNPDADGGLDRYEDRVYLNTGLGGEGNHWLRLRFSGVSHAALIGACVEIFRAEDQVRLGSRWIHADHAYKSGGPLQAHFGLGSAERVDLHVTLLDGTVAQWAGVRADRFLDVDLKTHSYVELP
ncbi:MAG: CRTAC1 family protein [Myxococcota bacterium]